MRVRVPLPLPNKANEYQVHFHPLFWKNIYNIASELKLRGVVRGPLYWVGPGQEVKNTETAIGFIAKQCIADDTLGPVRVEIWISNRLDVDGVKAVLDGIQASGRIKNDRQVQELVVHKLPMKNEWFEFDITPLDNSGSQPASWGSPGAIGGQDG